MQITSPIGRGLLFFVTYVLFLYIYSPGLFYDEINLHMDDLLDYSGKGRDCYLAGGRWALALYREVFGGTALRCSNLTAGLYLCGALLVQIHILHIQRWISALAYVGVYLSCAQFAEFSLYLVMADAVALSVFFASLAVYMVSRANRKNKLILCGGVTCLTLAMGIYQASVLVYGSLFLCIVLESCIKKRIIAWRKLIAGIAVAIAALSLALFFARLAFFTIDISRDVTSAVEAYQAGISNLYALSESPVPISTLGFFFVLWGKLALGWAASTGLPGKLLIIPHAVCILVLWTALRQKRKERVYAIVLYVALAFLPYILPVAFLRPSALTDSTSQRMFLAAPVALSFAWYVLFDWMQTLTKSNIVRRSGIGVIVICCISAAYHVDNLFKGMRIWATQMNEELMQIKERSVEFASRKGLNFNNVHILIMFHDQQPGIDVFCSHPLISNIHLPTIQEENQYRTLCDKMPLWPAEGSMIWAGTNTLIVNYK